MLGYFIKRICYALPILLGVNLITFFLFFVVNTPDDMARMHLGNKHVTAEQVSRWKQIHGFAKPVFYNNDASGFERLTETMFYTKTVALLRMDFGASMNGRDIASDIKQRMGPSLAIAVPTFFIGLAVNISVALFVVLLKGSFIDTAAMMLCVVLMSISGLFYIIFGQYWFAKVLQWVPVSGYHGGALALKFLILPVAIGVISGLGAGVRWYRTIFLEEMNKEYVKTARAKGLSDFLVLYRHVLSNALLPILTGVVVIIPSLFMGSLIMESFFGIPGLGSYTLDAIAAQDFNIVRSMVFIGTVLYILGLLLTDLSYCWADPRVRIGKR